MTYLVIHIIYNMNLDSHLQSQVNRRYPPESRSSNDSFPKTLVRKTK